jgi:EAL and modified HD-GYP domain-containing signal transduction protein
MEDIKQENQQEDSIVVLARQPILDKNQKIFGYEIFSRKNIDSDKSEEHYDAKSDNNVMFNILSTFGTEGLLQGKNAFLNCILEDNNLDSFELISPKNVILEIQKPQQKTAEVIQDFENKIKTLKTKGYKIAFASYVFEQGYEKLLVLGNFLKIDIKIEKELKPLVRKARMNNLKIVAEKVENMQEFERCFELDFDYYQGYFFSKPINLEAKITNPSVNNLIRLMNLTMQEADFKEIESVLKTDPTLSFKLLRYLNSYGVGHGIKVDSFQKALLILGYKQLFKWLSILFTNAKQSKNSEVVAKTALVRAKFMEMIANEKMNKAKADHCFVVGLFSLLDAMLNVRMDVALGAINIADEIKSAILDKEGEYAPLLALILSLENNDWIDVFASAYELKLTNEEINSHYMKSVEWVEQLNIS